MRRLTNSHANADPWSWKTSREKRAATVKRASMVDDGVREKEFAGVKLRCRLACSRARARLCIEIRVAGNKLGTWFSEVVLEPLKHLTQESGCSRVFNKGKNNQYAVEGKEWEHCRASLLPEPSSPKRTSRPGGDTASDPYKAIPDARHGGRKQAINHSKPNQPSSQLSLHHSHLNPHRPLPRSILRLRLPRRTPYPSVLQLPSTDTSQHLKDTSLDAREYIDELVARDLQLAQVSDLSTRELIDELSERLQLERRVGRVKRWHWRCYPCGRWIKVEPKQHKCPKRGRDA
ncbi:hypothetical protein DFP72DRAFT_849001 [Ephemerocybe angulata]|uniref:Uncharacterized protein n=1 Tax=Ephemerocybe angulata TaxID=980116 RepID=A0A8H6HV35_9AGAR|nr:hypothetical protein DFP72DRAFT_849001 [Tulosesus angulatus]